MKRNSLTTFLPTALNALALAWVAPASAANISPGDAQAGGITYAFEATFAGTDSGAQSSSTGAWSWEDQSLLGNGLDHPGWTHTSDWFAITLEADCVFTLTLERDATVPIPTGGFRPVDALFPSFTLWQGVDNDLMPAAVATALGYDPVVPDDHHIYNNRGNVEWAEDLTYIDHLGNSTLEAVSRSWTLSAGQYSLVIGSDASSAGSPPRQGFRASFTASPVPEPTAAMFAGLAGLGLIVRRRRARGPHR